MTTWGNYAYVRAMVGQLRTEIEGFERDTVRTERDLIAALRVAQHRQLELSMMVIALIETLQAGGQLDVDVLEGRLENLRVEQPRSAANPEPVTPDRPYLCASCFRAIAIADGTLVADGMHCSRCMAGRA
jgi:hypothetical protein